jgi:uncharacterized Zn finger protein
MAATKNTDTAADEIPRGFNLIAAHMRDITVVLNAIEQQMGERNDLLRGTAEAGATRAPVATIADADVLARIDRLENAMGTIPGKMDDLTALVKSIAAMVKPPAPAAPVNGEAKAIANRIIEHTVAQVQAGAEAAPAKRGRGRPADPKKCAHPEDKVETLENGLRRCTRCGTVLEATVATSSAEQVSAAIQVAKEAGRDDLAQAIVEKVIAGPPVVISDEKVKALAAKAVEAVKEKLAERIEAEKPVAQTLQAVAANITPIVAEKKPAKVESVFKNIDGKMVEVDPETLEPIAKVEEKPLKSPEPKVEAPKATLDDVRAVAIGYAGKHGKEKLGAVLVKYGAGNLSSVPAEKYDALMAELQAAG